MFTNIFMLFILEHQFIKTLIEELENNISYLLSIIIDIHTFMIKLI